MPHAALNIHSRIKTNRPSFLELDPNRLSATASAYNKYIGNRNFPVKTHNLKCINNKNNRIPAVRENFAPGLRPGSELSSYETPYFVPNSERYTSNSENCVSNLCSSDMYASSASEVSDKTLNTNMSVLSFGVVDTNPNMATMPTNSAPIMPREAINFFRAKCDLDELISSRSKTYIDDVSVNVAMDNEYEESVKGLLGTSIILPSDEDYLVKYYRSQTDEMKNWCRAQRLKNAESATLEDSQMDVIHNLTDSSDEDDRSSKLSVYDDNGTAKAVRQKSRYLNLSAKKNTTPVAEGLIEEVYNFRLNDEQTERVRHARESTEQATRKRTHAGPASREVRRTSLPFIGPTPTGATPIPTQNQFGILGRQNDNQPSSKTEKSGAAKQTKNNIPVITVKNPSPILRGILSNIAEKGTYSMIGSPHQLTIKPLSSEVRTKILNGLRQNGQEFFTHPLAKQRGFVAVLKGIPLVTAAEMTFEMEQEYGVKPINVTIFNANRKDAYFGTYAIEFEKGSMDFTAIQEIKVLFDFRCKWEKMKQKNKKPTICLNCCAWGHGMSTCGCASRCLLCAGAHKAADCILADDQFIGIKPKVCCANCTDFNARTTNGTQKLKTNHEAFDEECCMRAKYLDRRSHKASGDTRQQSNRRSRDHNRHQQQSSSSRNGPQQRGQSKTRFKTPTRQRNRSVSRTKTPIFENLSYKEALLGGKSLQWEKDSDEDVSSDAPMSMKKCTDIFRIFISDLSKCKTKSQQLNLLMNIFQKCLD